jgi:hypothetical protein
MKLLAYNDPQKLALIFKRLFGIKVKEMKVGLGVGHSLDVNGKYIGLYRFEEMQMEKVFWRLWEKILEEGTITINTL